MEEPRKKICFIINKPVIGGAEGFLMRLMGSINDRFECHLIFLNPDGPLYEKFKENVYEVHSVRFTKNPLLLFTQTVRLIKLIRRISPQVVHTWLYLSDFLGGIATRLSGTKARIYWSIRHSNCSFSQNRLHTFLLIRTCGVLTRWVPDAIISCSVVAARTHVEKCFYKKSRIKIIPNGFNTALLQFNHNDRIEFRTGLNICVNDSKIVAFIGRFDVQKGVDTFISVSKQILQHNRNTYFAFIGSDCVRENNELWQMISDAGLIEHAILMGPVMNIRKCYSGLDLAIIASRGEAFPNVLAEVMSMGIPVVTTNVGDIPIILEGIQECFDVADINGMAAKSVELLELSEDQKRSLSAKMRNRIVERYSLDKINSQFVDIYE